MFLLYIVVLYSLEVWSHKGSKTYIKVFISKIRLKRRRAFISWKSLSPDVRHGILKSFPRFFLITLIFMVFLMTPSWINWAGETGNHLIHSKLNPGILESDRFNHSLINIDVTTIRKAITNHIFLPLLLNLTHQLWQKGHLSPSWCSFEGTCNSIVIDITIPGLMAVFHCSLDKANLFCSS